MPSQDSISSSEHEKNQLGPEQQHQAAALAKQEALDAAPKHTSVSTTGPPPFKYSSIWSAPVLNPLNLKSYTVPFLNIRSAYGRTLHLSWLGFFVAFTAWFSFSVLIHEAIKADLNLTQAQVANSNIIALLATLVIRLCIGPAVDRFGPRYVMCALLVVGAIPTGLSGTANSAGGIYAVRFFVGILGGTFVPCVSWTTAFFDKNVVGTVNGIAAGLGNAGGGATYAIMVSLYATLRKTMSQHVAWRVAFAVVPVPILIITAIVTLIFGQDHPAGKWSQRHLTPATAAAVQAGHEVKMDHAEIRRMQEKKAEPEGQTNMVREVSPDEDEETQPVEPKSTVVGLPEGQIVELDVAVNETLTVKSAMKILVNPLTWLPALAYMTSFGFELAVDSNLGNDIFRAHPSLGWIDAGYLASIFGLLNIFCRPIGGIIADMLYARFGVRSKKYLMLGFGMAQGCFAIGFGQLLKSSKSPDLGSMMGLVVMMALACNTVNGINFSLVPHCNSYNNGVMSGIVGAFGNVGGICYSLMWRFKPNQGVAWMYAGVFALVINFVLLAVPSPKH